MSLTAVVNAVSLTSPYNRHTPKEQVLNWQGGDFIFSVSVAFCAVVMRCLRAAASISRQTHVCCVKSQAILHPQTVVFSLNAY